MAGGERRDVGFTAADLYGKLRREALEDRPAYVSLVRLITAGGRLPYEEGVAGLTELERSLLHEVMGDDRLRLSATRPLDGDLFVAHSRQGKVSLLLRDEIPEVPSADLLAALRLSPAALERAAEHRAAWWAEERLEQAQLDRLLLGWERDGVLPQRLGQVIDWVDRVETVLIHIGRRVFSRSDAASNTLVREGVLAGLSSSPVVRWSRADRLFVAAAHLLFTTGGPIRFEEFNGRQLSATRLRAWLVSLVRCYALAVGDPVPADLAGRPLEELAAWAASLRNGVDRSGTVRFRRISGPAFAKREVLTELPGGRRSHAGLPAALADLAGGTPSLRRRMGLPAEAAVSGAAGELARRGEDVEGLLASIVMAAVLDLRADYGMSSAIRDLNRLAAAQPERASEVLTLRRPDFFCCVLPHPDFAWTRPGADLTRLLWSVSRRMQYNRWHFVPGNFDRSEVPAERHYFFPPTMPDLAEHSDLWHGGHVAAGVRYSIRAPGAQLWREPLLVKGNLYRGGYDIRAVRTEGPPFTRDDLWTAVRYSGLVDAFWRALARLDRPPVISGFGQNWYEAGGWKDYADPGSRRPAKALT